MHISAGNGATQLCIFEQWVAPAAGAPTHWHRVEEVLTVISGEAEMWINEKHAAVSGGRSLIVPAYQRHGFRNSGSVTLHIHAVLASSFFEATFDGSAEPVRRWFPPLVKLD
jgi:mannose-6-phosphate isomerase-like protein (cupin superfamily)